MLTQYTEEVGMDSRHVSSHEGIKKNIRWETIKELPEQELVYMSSKKQTIGTAVKSSSLPALTEIPLERQNELLERTISFYEKTFADAAECKEYLESLGITDAGLFSKHRLGFANGSLLKALPRSGKIIDELKTLGVLSNNGNERFHGCVVIPILDVEGNITTLYGQAMEGGKHIYLLKRQSGLFNCGIMKTYPEIIFVGSVLDVLSMEMCGIHNAVSIQNRNGLSERGIKLMKEHEVTKIILLLDGDKPGQDASIELMGRLSGQFSVKNIPLPDNMDPNEYLVKHGPEKLQSVFSLAAAPKAPAKEKIPIMESSCNSVAGNSFSITFGLRKYQIVGLEKRQRNLRATIRAEKGGRLHVDTIDFYSAKMRKQLAQDICLSFEELPETVNADIKKLLTVCEAQSDKRTSSFAKAATTDREAQSISLAEKQEAEAFGMSGKLIENVIEDFVKCGLVGEENNKLLSYLAMTSRKMEEPLSVLILSSSGAGKTALQDAVLDFCPPEDLVKLTSLSARALFYKEKTSLRNKVLAIEEGAGAEEASYAIRNLISSDSLTSEVAIRDPQTGKLTTMTNTVEGPASVFCTTTNPEVDPETKSRFLVTGIDESREQTRRILEFQRQRHSVEGLKDNLEIEKILRIHRNFQRMLKPFKVVNPLVDKLGYADDRLQGRRAQPQYLNLISTVAFLRQMRKQVRICTMNGGQGTEVNKAIEFIEVDEKDIELGNRLALEILGKTLDELSIPARDLLGQLEKMIGDKFCELRKCNTGTPLRKSDIGFSRREVREFTGWTQTRLRTHLKELIDLEYVLVDGGCNGKTLQTYKFIYDGQGKDGSRFIPGAKGA